MKTSKSILSLIILWVFVTGLIYGQKIIVWKPSSGMIWKEGEYRKVEWKTSDVNGNLFIKGILCDKTGVPIGEVKFRNNYKPRVSHQGCDWRVGELVVSRIIKSGLYRLKLEVVGTSVSRMGEHFKIVNPVALVLAHKRPMQARMVSFLSPKYRETLTKGRIYYIKWNRHTTLPSMINLVLYRNGRKAGDIAKNTKNNGQYSWKAGYVSTGKAWTGSNYSIYATNSTGRILGKSAYFNIKAVRINLRK